MITYVQLEEVTLDDLAWIKQDNEAHPEWEVMSTEEVLEQMALGKLHMLRWSGVTEGITLFRGTTAKRIEVTRTIGDNQLYHWDEMVQVLRATAREWGCVRIETLVHDKRVANALGRHGARVEAVRMVLEVDYADASG